MRLPSVDADRSADAGQRAYALDKLRVQRRVALDDHDGAAAALVACSLLCGCSAATAREAAVRECFADVRDTPHCERIAALEETVGSYVGRAADAVAAMREAPRAEGILKNRPGQEIGRKTHLKY